MALMTTACSRPHYLQASLTSWAKADHAEALSGFAVALGRSGKEAEQIDLIRRMAPGAHIWLDSPQAAVANGMHRAIAEAATRAFNEFAADFLIFTEEDLAVSSDIVTYMAWGAEKFAGDKRVLAVCAHSRGGQGWDAHEPAQDAGADQELVRLVPYFNCWTWGTWRDRWFNTLLPRWDFDCTSGGPADSGYDWNIATRILPQGNFLCAVPGASRSQNIGEHGGWASTPQSFAFSQAQSFRERRPSPAYRLDGELPPLVPTDPPEIEAELWRGLKGTLAFDVGARQGENIPHLAGAGFTQIVAVEPDEACVRALGNRFGRQCAIIAAAVSDHDGTVELAEVTTHNLGQVPTLVTAGTSGMEWAPADWGTAPKREVPCVTLDSLAAEHGTPDLVVVDTEGHEAKILQGAAKILAKGTTNWLIEFHGEDLRAQCIALLLEAGLRVRTIRHPHYPMGSHMYLTHGWIRGEVQ
jgi:FkbM family methyltransferase